MNEQTKLKTLRTICWIGVAADALWSVALVYPSLYGILTSQPLLQTDLPLRLTMGIGASLMMGWTLLLAWTAKNPVERKAVFLLTAFPVLFGLIIVTSVALINGNTADIWILVKCTLLTAAMLFGYHIAKSMARESANANDH